MSIQAFAPIVILRLRNMTAIDASGLHALETLSDRLHRSGRTLILCGALKIAYDVALLWAFRHVRPPEEQGAVPR